MNYVNQISVFVENKTGSLTAVTKLLADAGIDLRAFSIADTSEFGILRMIVDDPQQTEDVLKKANVTVVKTPVLAVQLEDRPGSMHHVMTVLSANQISVEYAYAFVARGHEHAYVVLRVDEPGTVAQILIENGLTVLDGDDLKEL